MLFVTSVTNATVLHMCKSFLLLLVLSCATFTAQAQPLQVTTTTGMIANLVEQIGKEDVVVTALMGPGVDPHTYKPTTRDIKQLFSADIIFYNGLLLEGKMSTVLASYSTKKPSVAIAETIAPAKLMKPDGFNGHPDPHVWMDVSLWSEAAIVIAKTLATANINRKSFYEGNLQQLQSSLQRLDTQVRASVATIAQPQRVLITAHDAFGYFGRAYNIEVLGIQGVSTESEAGLNDINRLVDFIVARKVKAVFVESSVSERNIKALIEGAAARNHQVIIGGELYSDAMGTKGSGAETYQGMILHNTNVITKGLGGTVETQEDSNDSSK